MWAGCHPRSAQYLEPNDPSTLARTFLLSIQSQARSLRVHTYRFRRSGGGRTACGREKRKKRKEARNKAKQRTREEKQDARKQRRKAVLQNAKKTLVPILTLLLTNKIAEVISQNDKIQAETFNSHAYKTYNQKIKFIGHYNTIQTSIM